MKCSLMEQWALLDGTGELSPGRRDKLEQHLSACPRCREFRATAAGILEQGRLLARSGGPSQARPDSLTLAAIRAEAARQSGGRIVFLPRPAARILAYAACAALLLGAWFQIHNRESGIAPEGTRAIVAMVSDNVLTRKSTAQGSGEDDALHALAMDLLIMEGLSEDNTIDLDMLWESPTESGEPSSTGIQGRSTLELQAREYV